MKNWLYALKCFMFGHKVIQGGKCPVTGIQEFTCTKCGVSNITKHENNGMSFS